MTPEQSARETQQAGILRSELLGQIYDGVQGAMADIHRRVIEEPWFGRTIYDVVYDRQMGNWGQGRDNAVDHEVSSNQTSVEPMPERAAQGTDEEKTLNDKIWQEFYSTGQESPQADPEQGYGMER